MNTMQVDVAAIGAGTAGLLAYRAAKAAGASAAIIDQNTPRGQAKRANRARG